MQQRAAAEQQREAAERNAGTLRDERDLLLERCRELEDEKAAFAEAELESIQARLVAERSRGAALDELTDVSGLAKRLRRRTRRLEARSCFLTWKHAWMTWAATADLSDERLLYKVQVFAEQMALSSSEQEELAAHCRANAHRLRELDLIRQELDGEAALARQSGPLLAALGGATSEGWREVVGRVVARAVAAAAIPPAAPGESPSGFAFMGAPAPEADSFGFVSDMIGAKK